MIVLNSINDSIFITVVYCAGHPSLNCTGLVTLRRLHKVDHAIHTGHHVRIRRNYVWVRVFCGRVT